jgi:hypothetical protein
MTRKRKAIEIISDMLQGEAESLRQTLSEALNDDNRSPEEREAIKKASGVPAKLEASARWWKTGEGNP